MNVLSGTPSHDPWLALTVRIAEITEETPGVATYDLQFTDPQEARAYAFQPGQFNMLYMPGVGESAISLSSLGRREGEIAHTIRIAGNVTQTLARLGRGGTLGLRGPFGNPWPLDQCRGRNVVVVSGGLGLAPLRPVVQTVLAHPDRFGRLTVLSGARHPENLLYQTAYSAWRESGATVEATVDEADSKWNGHVGVVSKLVDRMDLPEPAETTFLICGPDAMMWHTAQSAIDRGVPTENIWLNLERNMNCGIGLCGHCQFGPEFVCKEGPIIPFERLAPLLHVKDL